MYDLHTHTVASDGQYTADELVCIAVQKGISLLAITDHDSVGGVEAGRCAAEKAGIRFLTGIEISVKGAREMHILGYGIDVDSNEIATMCAQFQRLWDERKYRSDMFRAEGVAYFHNADWEQTNMFRSLTMARAWLERETIRQPLPKPVDKLDMTTLLQGMLGLGYPVRAIPTDGLWLECDSERDIEAYERFFASQLS